MVGILKTTLQLASLLRMIGLKISSWRTSLFSSFCILPALDCMLNYLQIPSKLFRPFSWLVTFQKDLYCVASQVCKISVHQRARTGPHLNSCYVIYAILIPSNMNSRLVALTFLRFQASLVWCQNTGNR